MPWSFPARQRIEALDQQVDALLGRLDEVTARLDRLSTDFHQLSSDLDHTRRRVEEESSQRRQQMEQLSAARGLIMDVRGKHRATADLVTDLQGESRKAADLIGDLRHRNDGIEDVATRQASVLDHLQEKGREQGQSLEQIRADLRRIELQAAADLSELRTTHAALARLVVSATGTQRSNALSAGTDLSQTPDRAE